MRTKNTVGHREHDILDTLSDGRWWRVSQIQEELGMNGSTYAAVRRLHRKGLLCRQRYRPKRWRVGDEYVRYKISRRGEDVLEDLNSRREPGVPDRR